MTFTNRGVVGRAAAMIALAAVALGCAAQRSELAKADVVVRSEALLVDGANGGPEGFYFLPPLAARPSSPGPLDSTLTPSVRVTELDANGAERVVVATFSVNASGPARLRVDPTSGFIANWQTKNSLVRADARYRIDVLLDGRTLGSTDVLVVSGPRVASAGPAAATLEIGQTLPIKFWLNRCAPVVCAPLTACHTAGRCEVATGQCSDPMKPACAACLELPNCHINAEHLPEFEASDPEIAGASLVIPPDAPANVAVRGDYQVAIGVAFPHDATPDASGAIDYQLNTLGHVVAFDEAGGPGYAFPPGSCATMTLPFAPAGLMGGLDPAATVRIYQLDDGELLTVPGVQSVDTATQTVTACVAHLSDYVVAQQGPARGAYQPSTIWPARDIPVCWEDPGDFGAERGWVRDQIERTWMANSRVNFTGWGACAGDSRGIRIGVEDRALTPEEISNGQTNAPRSLVGTNVDGVPSGMVLNFTYANWGSACAVSAAKRETCIRADAVHEFGHALGLKHEQNRKDSSCPKDQGAEEPGGIYGAYDARSVMNYCGGAADGVLSPTDIQLIRALYGAPPGVDLMYSLQINQAGGLFGGSGAVMFGEAACRDGATRTDCVVGGKSSEGNCYVVGWVNPTDSSDCRCVVHWGIHALSAVACIAEVHGVVPAPPCGGNGQACCGQACDSGLVCDNGSCTTVVPVCGSLNLRCCAGATCDAGLSCVTNECLPILPEICNGVDDDRDSQVDEGLLCHTISFRMSEVDDEAFLWIGQPADTAGSICTATRTGSGGAAECDLTSIVTGLGLDLSSVQFTLKLGNGGGLNTSGRFFLIVDGVETELSTQFPVVAHTGWTHRQEFTVDFVAGTFVAQPFSHCVDIFDCMN